MSQTFRTPEEIAADMVVIDSDVELDGEDWNVSLLDADAPLGEKREAQHPHRRAGTYLHSFRHEGAARGLVAAVQAVIARAIRQAISSGMLPPPTGEQQLADIRDYQRCLASNKPQNAPRWPSHKPAYELIGMLLDLLDHARAQVRWLAQDDSSSLEAFEAGKRAGRLEGRREVWEAVREESERREQMAVADRAAFGDDTPQWRDAIAISRALSGLAARLARALPWDGREPEARP